MEKMGGMGRGEKVAFNGEDILDRVGLTRYGKRV